MKAKFDPDDYDYNNKGFSNEEYCDLCDVWVKSRSNMQVYMDSGKHRRLAEKVSSFRCDLCHITVTCQATLNSHMRGKNHIKRVKQLEEHRKEHYLRVRDKFLLPDWSSSNGSVSCN